MANFLFWSIGITVLAIWKYGQSNMQIFPNLRVLIQKKYSKPTSPFKITLVMSKSERILVKPKSKSRKILLPAKSRFQFLYFRRGISQFFSYMPKYICSCFSISMLFLLGEIYLPYFIWMVTPISIGEQSDVQYCSPIFVILWLTTHLIFAKNQWSLKPNS